MDREKVIKGWECHMEADALGCADCPYRQGWRTCNFADTLFKDVYALLKAPDQDQLRRGVLDKEAFHRLMVHNTGNVDIPDGLTRDQFNSVADAFVEAIEHTFRGESWPYDQEAEHEQQ